MKIFYINLTLSILLIIGGFLAPPIGQIDNSVLVAIGLLLMFTVLAKLPDAIKAGRSIKLHKDDFTIEVSGNEKTQP